MRIFHWVHRHLIPKDGLISSHQSLRKDEEEVEPAVEMLNIETDTKALLDDHQDPNLDNGDYLHLHGWNKNIDGAGAAILSIGTFGMLKDEISVQENTFVDKEEEEEEDDIDGVEDHRGWETGGDRKLMNAEEEEDGKEKGDDIQEEEGDWKPLLCDKNSTTTTTAAAAADDDDEIIEISNLHHNHDDGSLIIKYYCYDRHEEDEGIGNKKKERTTLADLFSAESHHDHIQPNHHHLHHGCITLVKKNENEAANCSNKTKKKLPAALYDAQKDGFAAKKKKKHSTNIPAAEVKVQDSRPIQKLHGLMKRMLKRKIHPDTNNADPKFKPTRHPDFPVSA